MAAAKDLPDELWTEIFVQAGLDAVPSIACSCRRFRGLCADEQFWRALLLVQFHTSTELLAAAGGQYRALMQQLSWDRNSPWYGSLRAARASLLQSPAPRSRHDPPPLQPTALPCRVSIMGEPNTGKSALVVQLVGRTFNPSGPFDPTIEDVYRVMVPLTEEEDSAPASTSAVQSLAITDTGGDEMFRVLQDQWMLGADVCVFVYDITDANSWARLQERVTRLQTVTNDWAPAPLGSVKRPVEPPRRVPVILFGNKTDLLAPDVFPPAPVSADAGHYEPGTRRRAVPVHTVVEYARSIGADFMEGTARSHAQVSALFQRAALMHLVCVHPALPHRRPRPTLPPCALM